MVATGPDQAPPLEVANAGDNVEVDPGHRLANAPGAFLCVVGPTMREYWIVDRTTRDLCPPGTPILTFGGLER